MKSQDFHRKSHPDSPFPTFHVRLFLSDRLSMGSRPVLTPTATFYLIITVLLGSAESE